MFSMSQLQYILHSIITFWCIFYYCSYYEYEKISYSKIPALFVNYCQFLEESLTGTEYSNNQSIFLLKGLIITTRHGERLPLIKTSADSHQCKAHRKVDQKNFKNYKKFVNSYAFKNSTIPDTAFQGFPWYPSEFECQPGNMTVEGALQIIRLGKYLSMIYKDSGIFDGTKISITSTINYRTFQSSIAFIASFLFPNSKNDLNHLNVFNIKSTNQTVFCNDKENCYCNLIPKLRAEYEKAHSQMFYQDYPLLSQKINEIAEFLEIPPFSIPLQFFDIVLGGFACRRKPLPCFANNKCLSMETINKSIKATNDLFQKIFEKYNNHFAVEAFTISNNFVKAIKQLRSNHSSEKIIHFYSGHRTTLMPFIYIFGLKVSNIIPVYASRLIFEIYQSAAPVNGESIFFRILLNGIDHTPELIFCPPASMYLGMCYGKAFENFVETQLRPIISNIC